MKQRSPAARDATILTAGKRSRVVSAAIDFARAKAAHRGVKGATDALLRAVHEYDHKPDFSWYGGQVNREAVRDIVRLKREGKL